MAKSRMKVFRPRKDENGEYKVKLCAVCGEPLTPGEQYMNVWNFYNDYSMHCDCYRKSPRSRWETSEYIGRIYDIQDNFRIEEIEGTISDLEDLKGELEDRLYAMPEQLQYAQSGELLQERIDNLDSAISDLETIQYDYEEIRDREYDEDAKEEFSTEEEFEENKQSELEDKESEASDILSNLE